MEIGAREKRGGGAELFVKEVRRMKVVPLH
jgi:hypothetical protein